jgi:hypothetical protein
MTLQGELWCVLIDNPTSCKIHTVIHVLHAKNMSSEEIHWELCAVVYSQNIMRQETVRQWCRMFKDVRTNVHNEKWSGRPSVMGDDLVQSADQKINERWCFTISELSCEYPQISHMVLYEIITIRLGYHMFCARWVPKMLTMRTKRREWLRLQLLSDTTKKVMNFSVTLYE